jgi:hypothetical protein
MPDLIVTLVQLGPRKDHIDCGSGDDQAVINTIVDGDSAINCEQVTTG